MSVHKCPFNHEKLVAYASGNQSPKERVEVERHLAQCRICQQEVRVLEKTWVSLGLWDFETDHSKPKLADLKRRIAASKETQSWGTRFRESLYGWRTVLRPAPTLAFATITATLFLLPWFETQFIQPSPDRQPMTASEKEDSQTGQAILVADATKTHEQNDSEYQHWVAERNRSFELAVEAGETQRHYNRKPHFDGFTPDADVYAAQMDSFSNQPFVTTNRFVQGERVRLGN